MAGTQYWGTGRLSSTTASIAYTGTAGSVGTINTGVFKVRVWTTTTSFIAIDNAAAASSTSGCPMAAESPEYFTISPGQKVSACQASVNGTLYVTEIA